MISLDKTIKLQYILIIQYILNLRKPLIEITFPLPPTLSISRVFFLTIFLMVGNNKLYRPNPNEFVSYRISEKRWCFLTKFIFGVKGDINDKNK